MVRRSRRTIASACLFAVLTALSFSSSLHAAQAAAGAVPSGAPRRVEGTVADGIEQEPAIATGRREALEPGGGVAQRDGGPGNRQATRIDDAAFDTAGRGLRCRAG